MRSSHHQHVVILVFQHFLLNMHTYSNQETSAYIYQTLIHTFPNFLTHAYGRQTFSAVIWETKVLVYNDNHSYNI